ncbi:MAG: hypothetical protein ACHP8A_02690 [Terriglobales bacterium]
MVVRIFGIIDLFLLAIVPLRFVPGIRSLFLIVQGYDIANPNEKATVHDVPRHRLVTEKAGRNTVAFQS